MTQRILTERATGEVAEAGGDVGPVPDVASPADDQPVNPAVAVIAALLATRKAVR